MRFKKERGAVLPIIAFIMVAFSAVLVVLAQAHIEKQKRAQIEITRQKMKLIQEALDNHLFHFRLRKGDYPCAAPPDLLPGQVGFGQESDACLHGAPSCGTLFGTSDEDVAALPFTSPSYLARAPGIGWQFYAMMEDLDNAALIPRAFAGGSPPPPGGGPVLVDPVPPSCGPTPPVVCAGSDCIWAGSVPTRTLGIPDDMMLDEWGNRFTYVVTSSLASGMTVFDTNNGVLKVTNDAGQVFENLHYMVISHGPDGKGAFTANGVPGIACPAGVGVPADKENCDLDRTFIDTGFGIDVGTGKEEGDLLLWR